MKCICVGDIMQKAWKLQKFRDSLNDRISVTNPSRGNSNKVNLCSNHYWINKNNQLITSDNANYNPKLKYKSNLNGGTN